MSLKKYQNKRELKKSHEPKANLFKRKRGALRFVVQKHAASHLHYDFRLEAEGVLKSWAVPKGPSLDPNTKRLAIQVEDHPYDYRTFEGIIPEGYGAGIVMIWDKGTYSVDEQVSAVSEKLILEGIEKGGVHFTLNGTKLKGRFSLIKLKKEGNEWILIKSADAFASKEDITQKYRSVISDKTLEEIGSKKGPISRTRKKKVSKPHYIKPVLATLVDLPFDQEGWIFEIKLDGFRALAELNGKEVELYSRNFQSFNERFPIIVKHLKELKLDAIFDGEIVALDEKGLSHFHLLQNQKSENNIYFYVFDLLYFDGKDLRQMPLIERKAILRNVLQKNSSVRYLDHIEKEGKKFFKLCKKQGLEGVIGKNKQSIYASGERSKEWVKIQAEFRQEVVICGFTEPKNTRKNFGALIAGVYKNNTLNFAGHVGGGFTDKQLYEIKKQLEPLITSKCPFAHSVQTNTPVTWVEPKLICEVKFKDWTSEKVMRMPIFLGIRDDKSSTSVQKEKKEKTKKIISEETPSFITHKDKIYWVKEKITKNDLLHYYESVAPFILPYLIDRPESFKRFPQGISAPSFFQKNLIHYPEWLSTFKIEHSTKSVNYALIQDVKSLLYVVNLGCIEIHPWFSRIQHLDNPDFLIFDLDPEDITFDAVITTAKTLHDLLESIQIPSYCKTSGSRGLHVAVPLAGRYTYEQAKRFTELIAWLVNQKLPEITSLERRPKKRQKKVYIDCYQNNFGQTLAAPYSVRAKSGAPVSTPLLWSELKYGLDPLKYTIFTLPSRLKRKGDLFKPVIQKGVDLKKATELLQEFI